MKYSISLFIALFIISAVSNLNAQNKGTVHFELNYNKADYASLADRSKQKGISPNELARWITDNGRVQMKTEGMSQGMMPQEGEIVIFIVGEHGSVSRSESVPVKLSGRSASLGLQNPAMET